MSDFKAFLLEGLFYEQDGDFYVDQSSEHVSVREVLTPLLGQRVQFALHHAPLHGIRAEVPGAGTCQYPLGRGCPVRHDLKPNYLLSFHLDGVLRLDPWRVDTFEGKEVHIPWEGMVGHYGRLAVATIVDVEKMLDTLAGINVESLNAMGVDTRDLGRLLERLRQAGNK